ncbi:MAG: hypothetical protein JWM91_3927 [Rhodospirillales bacterium]|nr:hypothetical protein [Rhodospirillales bacterium]
MKCNLALAAATLAAFTMAGGFAMAQQTETTTATHATSSTSAASDAQGLAASRAKPGESYEWSVDTTTTKVPVHPTVTEKTTTTTNVVPPAVVNRHTSTTTTTSTGEQ